ncbi:MAG: ATPase, partial [Clostridia bacterium]|nr:ATPase [Clostridia bacterium]
MSTKDLILDGQAVLGIEFGSTRIKAVLIDETNAPIASGAYDWENSFVDNIWTYSLDEIYAGLKGAYASLKKNVKDEYGVTLKSLKAIGISGMMHGYMPFDKDENLLVPFRTWRNTITGEAATKLSDLFGFNIPQRWSIAHLYRAILIGEEHVKDITYFTTLAGFIHWKLTGEKVLGVGEASGMFPIDDDTRKFNADYIEKFNALDEVKAFPWKLQD